MAFLTLKQIKRNDASSVLDQASLEITFGEQRLWGPATIPPNASIPVPTPRVFSQSAGPFIIPAQLQVKIYTEEGVYLLPTASNPLNEIEANPVESGTRTLTYLFDDASYTLTYRVNVNFVTATYALIVGVGIAFITLVTTLINLVVNYVRTIGRLMGRVFRGSQRSRE